MPQKYIYEDYLQGESIFNEEWDVLVVLDACRPDALEKFKNRYDWLSDSATRLSTGSNSVEWLKSTFDNPEVDLSKVGYITGNPYTGEYVDNSCFGFVEEVWKSVWDNDIGTIKARPVTDYAIEASRNRTYQRLIIHYMQPHFPSVPDPVAYGNEINQWGKQRMSVWEKIAEDEVTVDEAWEAYLDNLEYVLDDVNLLLNSIDAEKVVITSDHGEAFGEYGYFAHGSWRIPTLRWVPSVTTSATNNEQYTPKIYDENELAISTEERLNHLGYR